MPYYRFFNEKSGKEEEIFLKISELDDYKKNNPHMKLLVAGTPGFLGNYHKKPDDGFRDLLRMFKKNHPKSTIDTY